jgi:hypothetical protein
LETSKLLPGNAGYKVAAVVRMVVSILDVSQDKERRWIVLKFLFFEFEKKNYQVPTVCQDPYYKMHIPNLFKVQKTAKAVLLLQNFKGN